MKKEKIEKINEENLDDVSGGMYVGGPGSYPIGAIAGMPPPFIPRPMPFVPEIKEESELDKKIARLRELEKEVKNMNGVPSASTLEEMLNLRKYVDSFKEKFKDL